MPDPDGCRQDGSLPALMNRHHPEMQFDKKKLYQTSEEHKGVYELYKYMIIHPTPDRTNTDNNTSYQ